LPLLRNYGKIPATIPPRAKRGQTAVEYALVFAALLAVAGILGMLFDAVRKDASRAGEIVASEYP